MLEKLAASCSANPKICGPQMHKHTEFDEIKWMTMEDFPMGLEFKNKKILFEEKSHWVKHQ